MIGSLGKNVIFETTDKRILTPTGFTRTVAGRWEKHQLVGGRPQTEFSGPDLQGVTFIIKLRADMGVKPRQMLWTLEHMVETGAVEALVIGGVPLGRQWVVTDTSEEWDVIFAGGELYAATVSVTLMEYN